MNLTTELRGFVHAYDSRFVRRVVVLVVVVAVVVVDTHIYTHGALNKKFAIVLCCNSSDSSNGVRQIK